MYLDSALKNNWICKREYDFLKVRHPIRPVIYCLPKIHKDRINPPGRPIISSNGSLVEPLAQYIDYFLQPMVHTLPSYLADTRDILNCIKDIIVSNEHILVSLDVTSLYTNIPHVGGIEAVAAFMNLRSDPSPPTEFILDLLELGLQCNYFMFEGDFFLQVKGSLLQWGQPLHPILLICIWAFGK